MATGQLFFRGESSGVILSAILERPPAIPVRMDHELPPRLEDIINKALEKDRNLRYQSAAEIRADLQRLKRDTGSGQSAAWSPDGQMFAYADAYNLLLAKRNGARTPQACHFARSSF